MKKFVIFFLAILSLVSVQFLYAGDYALGNAAGGDGSIGDPFKIADAADINKLITTNSDWGSYFIVTSDIDCTSYTWTNGIGNNPRFTGNFDGQGYNISNVTINSISNVGFFGYNDGNISNLELSNITISGFTCGGFCAHNYSNGIISKCCVNGGSVSATSFAGGFCGENNFGIISNCYSTADVSGYAPGGFCGFNGGTATISNCYSTGIPTGNILGGFCSSNTGSIYCCFWNITTSGTTTGVDNSPGATITDVTGLSHSQFLSRANFPCFDFHSIWFYSSMLHPDDDTDLNDYQYPILRAQFPNSMIIPTLTEWAAILFIGLLAGVGGWFVWRRFA